MTQLRKPRSIFWWLGSKAFVANSTASGMAIGYFTITGNIPLAMLILMLWTLSLVTWNEYRAVINNI